MKKSSAIVFALLLFASLSSAFAQEWPQFMGPDRNSISPQKNLLRSWPAEGPKVLWSVNTGIGYGGPVVKNGKVYLLDRNDEAGDIMRCISLADGKELWKFAYDAPGSVSFPGSRSVPIVDDSNVYSCGPYGDLYCIDINTHKPVWNKNVWKDFGGEKIPTWAISQCPLFYGDLLILASQAPQAGVVAYDKKSGDLKWKTESLGLVGYVSPALVKIDGKDHVVMVTASGRDGVKGKVVGIDPTTGKVVWEYANWSCSIPVPSVVDAGNNKILVTGGYELGATMIQVEKKSDGTFGTKELFTTEEFGDQTKTPILYNGHFYAQYGTNSRRDGLACMNMNGEVLWKTKRAPDFNKGSMVLAEGLLLATDGTRTLYLIEPDPAGFKALASAEVLKAPEGGSSGAVQNWAPIALADGKLLIRDQSRMLCVQVAK